MKKFILVLSLLVSFQVMAQTLLEPAWKTRLRNLVTRVAGQTWGVKLLGEIPQPVPEITLPEIPKLVKKNTDIESYTKKVKEPTEYDKLPEERKRQFDYHFVKELFLVTRKTEARDEDLSNWLNTLEQGGSREGIYQALVLDEVYMALENMDEKSTERLMSFSLDFSQKFLNQTFTTESLGQLNLYSLKRVFTEKSLDLMEYYETKDLDSLYRWYAIFSADMAKDFQPLLKTPTRSNPSLKFHYEWAKGMPVQHIKSEYIIKLHTVMNGLQLLQ